jgi:molybdopterin synthase sulfur carrier subunit
MKIIYFAHVAKAAGCREDVLRAPAPIGAEALWAHVLQLHPELARFRPTVRLARNGEFAAPDAVFNDGDEVALLPPVSGG